MSATGPTIPSLDHDWEQWLQLPVRLANALRNAGKRTLRDVVDLSPFEVLQLRGVGKTCLRDLKAELAEYGLELRDNDRQRSVPEAQVLRAIDRIARIEVQVESLLRQLRSVREEMIAEHRQATVYEKGKERP